MVDPANIGVTVNLEVSKKVKQLRSMLGHKGY